MTRDESRLLWRCRRGARELDSILVPYGLARIHTMSASEKSNLGLLLDQQDPDLMDWFLGRRAPADSSIAEVIREVLDFNDDTKQVE